MFQKISKIIDNLSFSYITFKFMSDKNTYSFKFNMLTLAFLAMVIVASFFITSYSLIIKPFFIHEYKQAELKYKNQISLFEEYNNEMNEKKRLIKKVNKTIINVYKETETNSEYISSIDDCKNADCMMNNFVGYLPSSKLNAVVNVPAGMPAIGWICPIGCGFAYRADPFTGQWVMHYGVDIQGELGSPVISTITGTVVYSGYGGGIYGGYGNVVVLDNGYYKTLYAHMIYAKVHYGQFVKRGQVIGYMGNTGYSKGVHLHYGVITKNYIDSMEFLNR